MRNHKCVIIPRLCCLLFMSMAMEWQIACSLPSAIRMQTIEELERTVPLHGLLFVLFQVRARNRITVFQ
jgi:hypothetical protein